MSRLRREIRTGALTSLVVNAALLLLCAGGAAGALLSDARIEGDAIGGLVVAGIVGLINVLLIVIAIRTLSNVDGSARAKYLAGATGRPLDEVSKQVEEELAAMANGPVFSGVRLLPSFLYKSGTFGPTVIPIDDIAWIYKKVTTRRVNFVPVAKTYSVMVHPTDGPHAPGGFQFTASAQVVDEFLARLAVRIPWSIIGYNAGFAGRWRIARKEIVANMRQRQQAARAAAAPTGNIASG